MLLEILDIRGLGEVDGHRGAPPIGDVIHL